MKSVLAVAAEPWEIFVLASVLAHPVFRESFDHRSLVVADTYTLVYCRHVLELVKDSDPDLNLVTLDSLLDAWQTKGEPATGNYESWWNLKYGASRPFKQMMSTHQGLVGWEAQAGYLRMSSRWKERVAYDTLRFAESLIEGLSPTVVIGLERRTLLANALYEISTSNGIPTRFLIRSRIGDWWHPRSDFGLGTSQSEETKITSFVGLESQLLDEVRAAYLRDGHLYPSRTDSVRSRLNDDPRGQMTQWELLAKRWGARLLYGGPKSRSRKMRRLDQDFLRLTAFEARSQLRQSTASITHRQPRRGSLPDHYVLWTLHTRPEESVSCLGLGLDEFEEIEKVRALLPSHIALVVKENPQMVATRQSHLRQRIRSQPGVVWAEARMDTKSLLTGSRGVISLSGTSLLEGAIMGKPTWAIGRPEFEYVLTARGWKQISQFIDAVNGTDMITTADNLRISAYLNYLSANSSAWDRPFEYDLKSPDAENMVSSIADRLMPPAN